MFSTPLTATRPPKLLSQPTPKVSLSPLMPPSTLTSIHALPTQRHAAHWSLAHALSACFSNQTPPPESRLPRSRWPHRRSPLRMLRLPWHNRQHPQPLQRLPQPRRRIVFRAPQEYRSHPDPSSPAPTLIPQPPVRNRPHSIDDCGSERSQRFLVPTSFAPSTNN